jgi:CubicO group peptidase (beta-lactamase class C family)
MKRILISLLLLLISVSLFSQKASDCLDLKGLDEYIMKSMGEWRIPGLAIAVVRNDTVIYAKGYGVRDINRDDPVDVHTLFAIASNTKAFTASALAVLVDEGKIDWDDHVKDYLPWFELYDPYVSDEMRVRDLLCHRSGLKTFSGDLLWYGTKYSREEVIRRAKFLEPTYGFRYGYGYSNIMFLTAGEIIPVVEKVSWDQFIKKTFFDPLGMSETTTTIRGLESSKNIAQPHYVADPGEKTVTIPYVNWDNIGPAGSIMSNVSDMSKWIRFQLNNGKWNGKQIISEENIWETRKIQNFLGMNRNTENNRPNSHFWGYGMGWDVRDYHGTIVVSHGGGADGMISEVTLVPEEKFGLVILTNSINWLPSGLAEYILDRYFKSTVTDWSRLYLDSFLANQEKNKQEENDFAAKRVKDSGPSLDLEQYAGIYGGEMYGNAEVFIADNELRINFLPTPIFSGTLTHWHFDIFRIKLNDIPSLPEGTVQFIIGPDGRVEEMKTYLIPIFILQNLNLNERIKKDRTEN